MCVIQQSFLKVPITEVCRGRGEDVCDTAELSEGTHY